MPLRLCVVTGLPGVGKTTVSRALADHVDARLVRTDTVRADCVSDPQYTPSERATVYDEVFDRARKTLAGGRNVVLDGTFQWRADRKRAVGIAAETGATLGVVVVDCDESTVRDRITAREGDASDADFGVYREIRAEYDPVRLPHATVDNSGGLDATEAQVAALVDDG
jgi:predicted kinase